jgi:hypothetical protein
VVCLPFLENYFGFCNTRFRKRNGTKKNSRFAERNPFNGKDERDGRQREGGGRRKIVVSKERGRREGEAHIWREEGGREKPGRREEEGREKGGRREEGVEP